MSTEEPERTSPEGQHPDEATGMTAGPSEQGESSGAAPNPETGVGLGAGEASTFEPEEEADGPQE